MLKNKKSSFIFVIIMFVICIVFFIPHNRYYKIIEVISPVEFVLDSGKKFVIKDYDTFDARFTDKNKILARNFDITETEAFLLGNIAKNEINNLMKGREVYISKNNDLISFKRSYERRFFYSGYCIKDGKACVSSKFNHRLNSLRKTKFKVLDLESSKVYNATDPEVRKLEHILVLRSNHVPENFTKKDIKLPKKMLKTSEIKVLFSDFTENFIPDESCSSNICKELLFNINNSKKSIDIAIYGYSKIPSIEQALIAAEKRGVKIRLVYDLDSNGENIYPHTDRLLSILKNYNNDGKTSESNSIMHNKFFIFDENIVMTGSANLSSTDMSEFNSNSVIVINSQKIGKIYTQEFEQMFNGKFHSLKDVIPKSKIRLTNVDIDVYFSPKDKAIENGILPILRSAKGYIYIPVFFLTDKRVVTELIKAKNRNVDIRIIIDAVSASTMYSKHQELRENGILVKVENFAGKMHSKSMIVDDKYTIIGSMNFSNSGENKNDENLIIIQDVGITKFYKDFFLYQWNKIDDKFLKNNVRAESLDSIGSCYDGIDNNYDGLVDFEDKACKG